MKLESEQRSKGRPGNPDMSQLSLNPYEKCEVVDEEPNFVIYNLIKEIDYLIESSN